MVKDSNADVGFIFSIVQNWPTVMAACTKTPKDFVAFFANFKVEKLFKIIQALF